MFFPPRKMGSDKKRSAQRVEEALAKFKRTLDDLKVSERTSVAEEQGHSWRAP